MDKTAIRNFAIEARKILMKSAITEAGFYGITKDRCKDPVQKGNDFEVYETVAGTENRIFGDDIKRRANLVQAIKTLGFEQVIEETAYTWFNRIIAIRFMEVNNYLPTRVRVLSSETGSGTPDIITQADTVELNLTSDELEKIQTAKRENRYDDAFRMLFIKQCNELNAILPGLFEKTDDYMELLLKITYTGDGVIRMLVDSIQEDNFNVETEGQVEIIGWMYQYYNTELKDDTFAKLKKNVKITKERIPAATQLFTPDWIVRYMVENSLGRVWIEHLRAVNPSVDEKAKAEEFGWKYYLTEAEQDDNVQAKLVEIRKSYKDLTPQDITCIDPCMGSGHILVYMFDVLMDIYRSEGFSEREAVFDILEKNIRGLDIDRRAYQLSYFALMMKARGYNRIFFRGHEDAEGNRVQAVPKVFAINESNSIDRDNLLYFGAGLDDISKNNAINQINGLLDSLKDAKDYGSIVNVDHYDWRLLRAFLAGIKEEGQGSLFGFVAYKSKDLLLQLIDIGETLERKYDAVVTNPPYMGGSNMNPKLSAFIKKQYVDYKSDLFSAFIVKCMDLCSSRGYAGFLSPYVWMFIQSYEKLREFIYKENTIQTLIQFEYSAFEEATVPICTFALRRGYTDKRGCYIRLTDYKGGMEVQRIKALEAIQNKNCGFYYESNVKDFERIPGSPVAYWLSKEFFRIFDNEHVGDVSVSKCGMGTSDNAKFLRLWSEVDFSNIGFNYSSIEETTDCKYRWMPYDKGGDYRKWYGNRNYVVNFYNNGEDIREATKDATGGRVVGTDYYFLQHFSWSDITSSTISFRFFEKGFIYDASANSAFCESDKYLLGYANSGLVNELSKVINPTFHFKISNFQQLPFSGYKKKDEVEALVEENIAISKEDWDSFEMSWGFKEHPLVRLAKQLRDGVFDFDNLRQRYADKINNGCTLELCYLLWEEECSNRFEKLKHNEETLNSIFIDIYDLKSELSPFVEDKDVSVNKADLRRDMRSLVSYIVGCMFGRYSIDVPGLICAGKGYSPEKYESFKADRDNIIPITDEKYFDDDIVARLEEFMSVVFGRSSLEENLVFLADTLETKGNSARERIRSYFLNDFFKDHCSMYSVTGSGKRPIYWLFDSGRQNGFKCLVYLHRYNPDTTGLIRSDYLTKTQSMIENALRNAEYAISSSSSAVDKAQATKKRDKYIKQLAEIRAYYPALSHIALQRIDLNLDDGVKANYEKFQNIEVSVEGEKKQKVNLLAKI